MHAQLVIRALGTLLVVGALLLAPAGAAAAAPRAIITAGPPPTTESTDATLTFAATSNALLARFECRFDGGAWAPCASPVTLRNLIGGAHAFDVRLIGLLTNTRPDTRAWTITRNTVVAPPPLPPEPPAPLPAPADGCAHGAASPRRASPAQLEAATLCLINRRRADQGLRALRRSRALSRVARRYATTMTRMGFFAHTSPGGSTFEDRIRASGYLRRGSWAIGEVLGWSSATPASQVRDLMRSPPHRATILTPSYRDLGVGIAKGALRGRGRKGMLTVGNFGRRG